MAQRVGSLSEMVVFSDSEANSPVPPPAPVEAMNAMAKAAGSMENLVDFAQPKAAPVELIMNKTNDNNQAGEYAGDDEEDEDDKNTQGLYGSYRE